MEDINKKRILTRDNYVPWFKRLIEETCHMQGIDELLMDGKEKEFRVKEPEYRIPAIKEGDALTPDNRQREGYIFSFELSTRGSWERILISKLILSYDTFLEGTTEVTCSF